MELWIRSQDRIVLKKLQDIEYYKDGKKHFVIGGSLLGEYKTKERCLEIIDEIQKLLLSANPKEAFMLVDCRNENSFSHIASDVDCAREHNFIAFDGSDGTSVQLIQPSVLVYEMPQE
jgi:hypothetical protein